MTGAPDGRAPKPPERSYDAVIFSSRRREGDAGDAATSDPMLRPALRDADGFGITASDWRDEASLRAWKGVQAHRGAQRLGRSRRYAADTVGVERIETLADSAVEPRAFPSPVSPGEDNSP